jgi:hypothetical protein
METPKRCALAFLTVSSLAILLIFFVDVPALGWLFAVLVMGFPIALVTLAVEREGQLGRLRLPLIMLAAMLQCGVIGVLAFSGSGRTGLYGLPLSLHFLLLLIWLGPLCVTTTLYAVTFSALGIDEALLNRLEQRRRERIADGEPP